MGRAKRRPSTRSERERFLAALQHANAAAVELRVQHHHFRRFCVALKENPGSLNTFAQPVLRWYLAWALIGVRRLMDEAGDARSLEHVLRYIGNPKNGVTSANGEFIDPVEVGAHRATLLNACRTLREIANRKFAHATEVGGDSTYDVSLTALGEAIDQIESISARYAALVTGRASLTRDDGSVVQARLAGLPFPTELADAVWPSETTMPTVRP